MAEWKNKNKNNDNLINPDNQINSKGELDPDQNIHLSLKSLDSQNSQDSEILSFSNGKVFEIIKLIALLIFCIILSFEIKYITDIKNKKKEVINNLTNTLNYYNSKGNVINDNSTSNIIQSSIISIEVPKTTNTTIKISSTNIIKKIETTNINTIFTTNKINIINSTNINNYFTNIIRTNFIDGSIVKDPSKTNIDIGNNDNTIINELNCSSGYFISYDVNGNKLCQKCYIEHCSNCTDDGICKSCEPSFLSLIENEIITSCEYPCDDDPEKKCLSCENENKCNICDIGYKLIDGKCLINYSIKAVYYSNEGNNNIQLINNTYEQYILEMIVDGNKTTPTYNYTFQDKGNHTVCFLLNNNIISLEKMFNEIYNITSIIFTKIFNTENIKDMNDLFSNCESLTYIDISNFNTKNVQNIDSMFYYCTNLISINLSNFNTHNVVYMGYLFSYCEKLTNIDISNFDTQNVIDMRSMFSHCSSLTSINVSKFNTKNVNDMSNMFSKCTSLSSICLSNFNTQTVTDLSYMFSGCTSLTSINISNFDTKNVENMSYMFSDCKNLKSINLLNFDTRKVNKLQSLFSNCNSLISINLSNFNTENVDDMKRMFENCLSLKSLNLSNFDTKKVSDIREIFHNCKDLIILDISSFNIEEIKNPIFFGKLFDGISSSANIIVNKDFYAKTRNQLKSLNVTAIE